MALFHEHFGDVTTTCSIVLFSEIREVFGYIKEEERERINECEVKIPELISENLDQIPNN